MRPHFNFSRIAAREVVPVLLELLARQDEDAGDEDYNISRAAYQCLQLYAQTVGGDLIQIVLGFVEQNLRHADWHWRDAAVSAFGAIMEGPDEKMLDPLIKQALPVLIGMMDDSVVQVKDSAAYALGRICENVSEAIDPQQHLPQLISALFAGLSSNPKMAGSCCWALMNLADRFAGLPGCQVNPLSIHFQDSVTHLLRVTERQATNLGTACHFSGGTDSPNSAEADNQLRMAAYEVLNSFVTNAANDSLHIVAKLSDIILHRLENTVPMQRQIVSVEDRITLEEIQTSLTSVLLVSHVSPRSFDHCLFAHILKSIIQRLEGEIKPQADRIMHVLLQILNTIGPKSSVPDTVFAAVGALSNALEADFAKYMDSFAPFLYNALGNQDELGLCAMAIGLVSDITRSLGEASQPYCDTFMNYLLSNLRVSAAVCPERGKLIYCRAHLSATNSSRPFFSASETLLRLLAHILSLT